MKKINIKNTLLSFLLSCGVTCLATNYYVNDASLVGDVYATAVGNTGNDGLTPATPKATIMEIVNAYNLNAQDTVFVDAGTYNNTNVVIDAAGNDEGSVAGNLVFMGADSSLTRLIAPGASSGATFYIENISYITVCKMYIESSNNRECVYLVGNSDFCEVYENYHYCTDNSGWGMDMGRSGSDTPDFNDIHDNYMNSGTFGFRIKSTGSGVFLDGNIVRDNTVFVRNPGGPSFEIQRGTNTQVYSNRFIGNAAESVLLDKEVDGLLFQNNYLVNPNNMGIFAPAARGAGVQFLHNSIYAQGNAFVNNNNVADWSGWTFRNNIVYSVSGLCIDYKQNGDDFEDIDCNVFWHPGNDLSSNSADLTAWQAEDHEITAGNGDANSFEFDPLFVDPANWNLDLDPSSPAIDVGCNVGVADDIYDVPRPQNAIVDIGAYEYQVPVPVEWLEFNTGCVGSDQLLISWSTASEENNDYFTIEASDNGLSFYPVSTVPGAGTSASVISYQYKHDDPAAYYRIKQTDFDGAFNYTNIVSADCGKNDIRVIDNGAYITISAKGSYILSLYTITGQIVLNTDADTVYTLNKSDYASGMYVLKVISGATQMSYKLRF